MGLIKLIPYGYALLLGIFAFVFIKHTLHMFQQNRYELTRFLPWIKNQLSHNLLKHVLIMLPFLGYFLVFVTKNETWRWAIMVLVTLILMGVFYYFDLNKKYVKPLDVTHRVIRQIITFYILWALVFGLALFINHQLVWVAVSILLIPLNWILVLVVALITYPIEELVKKGYIHLAKVKLKKQPNLINIGITGSYGKTTTKHIVSDVLSSNYYTLMTPASFNTPMGITITIRNYLKPLHQVFVCEMGADKVNDIQYLSKLVQPQFGVVTAIGPQHLNTFKSLDNIINEKMRLIENLPLSGVGVINMDNEHIRNYRIKNKCLILRVGIESVDVDFRAINIEYTPEGSFFKVQTKDNVVVPFKTKLLGQHNVLNILVSVALAKQLGISWEDIQAAVGSIRQIKNRLELKSMFGLRFIDNSFNSNPISAMNSIKVLSMMPQRRIMITPGMIELGEHQYEYNYQFGFAMKDHVDMVVLIGKNQTKPIYEGLLASDFKMDQVFVVDSMLAAFDLMKQRASGADTILIENDLPDAFLH